MAGKAQVDGEGGKFRDALAKLASNGAFSTAERDGFARLHLFYHSRLEAFSRSPRFGDNSPYYDNPVQWAEAGSAAAPGCRPGDAASQQPVYDAANRGGDALDAVTGTQGWTMPGIRGALTPQPAAPALFVAATAPAAAPVSLALESAVPVRGRRSFKAPEAPPAAPPGAPPGATGPTPPPKPGTQDPPWFAKLMAMFPAEAVTAYMAGSQYFGGGHLWLAAVTLVALIAVRWAALTPVKGGPTNYPVLAVSAVSFLLWVCATADASLAAELKFIGQAELQKGASFLILIWTWVVPSFVRLDPVPAVPPERG